MDAKRWWSSVWLDDGMVVDRGGVRSRMHGVCAQALSGVDGNIWCGLWWSEELKCICVLCFCVSLCWRW